jgi:hypothetical protein
MKTKLILATTLIALTASAVLLAPFQGYDFVANHSDNIYIAVCVTNPPTTVHGDEPINTFSIKIVYSIKGTNLSGTTTLQSLRWLNVGDSYLTFGNFKTGAYQAFENYRVIPLGREMFSKGEFTNSLAGKSQDEQIQILFKRALDNIDRKMKEDQEDKRRLEH